MVGSQPLSQFLRHRTIKTDEGKAALLQERFDQVEHCGSFREEKDLTLHVSTRFFKKQKKNQSTLPKNYRLCSSHKCVAKRVVVDSLPVRQVLEIMSREGIEPSTY